MGEGRGFATLHVAKDLPLGPQQHVNSFTNPPDLCNYMISPHYTERIFKTNAPSPLAVTLEQLEVQCNVCKLP